MPAKLIANSYSVSAHCPTCQAVTSFEQKATLNLDGPVIHNRQTFTRRLYSLGQCAGCRRGGFAEILDRGNALGAALMDFYPFSINNAPLPPTVPPDIQAEFREAEECASLGKNRAASALFRSVLEKTLKANGYTRGNDPSLRDLQKRIDAAASDGVITQARQKKAHDDIRSLGNDVLHDDWRAVADEEVEDSHRYTQRILEDLYDDRVTVEAILTAKGRLPAAPAPPANP
jgi:hypothetical protein